MKPIRIALLGCGTVGGGVVRLLRANAAAYAHKLGAPLELAAVADRSLKPDRALGLTRKLITRDAAALVAREDIDIVVELFGGAEPARSLILQALKAGKDVVTGNKAMLAEHGAEIFGAAARAGRGVGFEASVGGGIPIIRILREGLIGDRHRAVYGIVNGTCNSILTTMSARGAEFRDALAAAQRAGLAEPDPTLDIGGHDAAHKLCLLAALAFGVMLKPAQVHTEGITRITQEDIVYARELGYVTKLLAIAKEEGGVIEARVHPTLLPRDHVLASINDAYNAIYIDGVALGTTLYSGFGAGRMPSATAVLADIMEIARERRAGGAGRAHALGHPVELIGRARVKPMDDVVCEYYLRFMARDVPGVLGAIASVLGRSGISIASVIQKGRGEKKTVPVIMRTHSAPERNLVRALKRIERTPMVDASPAFIRIEEHL
ncbi:MAG: homoserine dehydrogenase [Candidatus Binataceae bacterium]